MSNLGELFRQIRLSKKWSIREAARRMGISYSYLSILEKGIDPRSGKGSNPKPDTLKIISTAYDYPYEELMNAAGYLHTDFVPNYQFDLTVFISNINLIMGKMSLEEFSRDIHEKTSYIINPKQIRSYLNGDIEPFPGTLNILSKYANVTIDFWYVFNTEETLEYEREKYNEQLMKASTEQFRKDYLFFVNLRDDMKEWITREETMPYLKIAQEAQQNDITINSLKLIIETLISDRDKRQAE